MKPKATLKEIGDGLFGLFLDFAKDKTLDISILEIVPRENKERASWEIVYLTIVAIDFGVLLALKYSPDAFEILDIFHGRLELMASEKPNMTFMQDFKNRQLVYSDVIKEDSSEKYNNMNPMYAIGKKFTEVTGISPDDRIIMLVISRFGATEKMVRDFVKAFDIV
jgi:hypothetical protein